MGKERRGGKKSTTEKVVRKGTPKAPPSKEPGNELEILELHVNSVEAVIGPDTQLADVHDLKNIEMRWQAHFTAARKSINAEEFNNAIMELQSCVRFAEELGGYRLANSYSELGYVALRLDEFETANSMFRKALQIRETAYGAQDPSVAIEYNNIAMTYEWFKDYDGAKPFLMKAVQIIEQNGEFNSANQAEPYESLASVFIAQGDMKKAEQYCMKAIQIRDELLGRLHPLSMKTVQFLLQIHRANSNTEGAASARAVYTQRLREYASTKTMSATAQALRNVLDTIELSDEKEPYDVGIGDFLKLMARR